jgi:hypothetical protein
MLDAHRAGFNRARRRIGVQRLDRVELNLYAPASRRHGARAQTFSGRFGAGRRAVIPDTDWCGLVWHASNPARMDRMLACRDDTWPIPGFPPSFGQCSPAGSRSAMTGSVLRSIRGLVQANGEMPAQRPEAQYDGGLNSRP